MLPGLFRQEWGDVVERRDEQIRIPGQTERIEPLMIEPQPRKFSQRQPPNLVVTPFLCRR